jgi:hypothetical protein
MTVFSNEYESVRLGIADTKHNLFAYNNYSTSGNLGTDYMDDIFMRKYVSTEPEHGVWGSEEVLRS